MWGKKQSSDSQEELLKKKKKVSLLLCKAMFTNGIDNYSLKWELKDFYVQTMFVCFRLLLEIF